MATIYLKGQTTHTCGETLQKGQTAPSFSLLDTRLKKRTLDEFTGQRKLIYTLPSLDTPVCAQSTRKLYQLLQLAKCDNSDFTLLIISADLPFAQQRFCKQHKLHPLISLSVHNDASFGQNYGLFITDGPLAGLLARSLLVLDEQNTVLHAELVNDITDAPDFSAALHALQSAAETTL